MCIYVRMTHALRLHLSQILSILQLYLSRSGCHEVKR